MAETRADDRAHGVDRSLAPLCVQRCRARDARRSTEPEEVISKREAELFSLFEEELRGTRPDRLSDVRPGAFSGTPWSI